jgi:hypothetical protein
VERQVRERFERIEGILEGIAQRQGRFDRQVQTTRKLVEAGVKMVTQLAKDTRELKQSQKAFLDFVPQRWKRQNALSLIMTRCTKAINSAGSSW